ncbi:flagellar basal body P-ring formation chaperone FlgA [Sphaerotilus mobilis]|uniref:Flagella basal body P-ring formation protein FlgA n=1 Tax=Sphaerotilus mobilis TaxID=47994 RepID=A0A4Q7LQT9_9BURK|nr:flagellar basal body P-ring formation chaperone FlgA [Sphaerotilus mobilis]RZS57266.1 flagella basal body P-ring formation protein FlgA [Sphaerotilus mobilis]
MSSDRPPATAHAAPARPLSGRVAALPLRVVGDCMGTLLATLAAALLLTLLGLPQQARAQTVSQAPSQAPAQPGSPIPLEQILGLARDGAGAPLGARVDVIPGQLDPRLRLAPCEQIQPYLPPGARPWGKTRVGLRCTRGAVAWNVFLPVTVKVWAPAIVTAVPVAADTPLAAEHLQLAVVDIAESNSPVYSRSDELIGRRLSRAQAAGATLRADTLRARIWFGAGDLVQVDSVGNGFRISGEAEALSPGVEGQPVRLRAASGKLLSAWPVGERRAEIRL